jgi:hypothetical protein
MKSKLFMAALAVAMIFSSCNNEEIIDNGTTNLTVKVDAATSRAIGAPSTNPHTIAVSTAAGTGMIFLIAPDNSISQRAAITAALQAGGQTFSNVPSSSRVFVVANVTDAAVQTALTTVATFTDIQALMTAIGDYQTAAYTNVTLSNASGTPASIAIVNPTTATANVSISPVLSRIELAGVTGGDYIDPTNANNVTRITGFDVIGVFVDSYAPNFTYIGGAFGTLVEINQQKIADPAFTPAWTGLQDRNIWTAAGAPLVAAPAPIVGPPAISSPVWSYYVPAGNVSRLIIALDNVTFEESTDGGITWVTTTPQTLYTGIQYLTVGAYIVPSLDPVNPITNMLRGYIYQIAADQMVFSTNNLHETPNPTDVNLTVNVTVQNWVLASSNPILE